MSDTPLGSRNQFIQMSARILECMANAQRMSILIILTKGEVSVGTLSLLVGLSQSALSQHLSKLRKADLVTSRRDAQTIYYKCNSAVARKILEALDDMFPAT